jgi:hypothetical protein
MVGAVLEAAISFFFLPQSSAWVRAQIKVFYILTEINMLPDKGRSMLDDDPEVKRRFDDVYRALLVIGPII